MTHQIEIGSVVYSKQGRDRGHYFVCAQIIDDRFVLVCDGEVHKLSKPKRKNVRHIKPNGTTLETIRAKLLEGKKVFDSELRKSLRPFNEQQEGSEETHVER